MNTLTFATFTALVLSSAAQPAAAAGVEIRFYPQKQLWTYELEAARHLSSAVLQNTAIVNRGDAPVVIGQVRFDLVRSDQVVLSRTLHTSDLDAAAKGTSTLAAAGMFEMVKFQFSPQDLFGKGATFAASRTLAPGNALYLSAQVFAFSGRPETVRVTVDFEGDTADVITALPLRYGSAPGAFRFPLHGRWINGAGSTPHSHHRWAVPEEFAFDFVRYGASGGTYSGDGTKPTDYYAYAQPVYATADGEVVAASDSMPDNVEAMRHPGESLAAYQKRLVEGQGALLAAGTKALAGNHVILRHAEGVYSVYGHLKPGSVKVKVGEQVKADQLIGAVGTSGNTTEPHLHFHLCDAPDPLQCVGMPVTFTNIEIPISENIRQIQTGDLIEVLK